MDAAVQAELDKLKKLIINAMPVEQIYLFGSYAYGTPRKDSDLDLYVVLKDDNPLRDLDAGLQIRFAIARKKSMPVDIIAKKKEGFCETPGRYDSGADCKQRRYTHLWINLNKRCKRKSPSYLGK